MTEFFTHHQLLLWILTVFTDLGFAVLCYRPFGRTGLYGVIIFSLILANIMGAKYVFKFIIAVVDTQFIYWACRWKPRPA